MMEQLASSVIQAAVRIWLDEFDSSANSWQELISAVAADSFEERRLRRELDGVMEVVDDHLRETVVRVAEMSDIDLATVVDTAAAALGAANLSRQDLFDADLDPAMIERRVRERTGEGEGFRYLSNIARALYGGLLVEACNALAQIVISLPEWQTSALSKVLKRPMELSDRIARGISHLPTYESGDKFDNFEGTYRRSLIARLDRLELVGATLPWSVRNVSLSAAYTDLDVRLGDREMKAQWALVERPRLLLRGEAGSGKTTLLSWIAVMAARRALTGPLIRWNDLLPFFFPMERLQNREFPAPSQFIRYLVPELADAEIVGGVQKRLRAGRVILLLDGIDEIAGPKRSAFRTWVDDLVGAYPDVRVIITSRPSAASREWLEEAGFTSCDLLPLRQDSSANLIKQWFFAMTTEDRIDWAVARSESLIRQIEANTQLRGLAASPLMCTLMCGVAQTFGRLPPRRVELYRLFCETLIERRDLERGIPESQVLSSTEMLDLLSDLALWMMLHDELEIPAARMQKRIGETFLTIPHRKASPEQAARNLLERSGILCEPSSGRIQFVHRSLQSYLAAKAILDNDRIPTLLEHAEDDRWRETFVMAAGEARAHQADVLLRGLLRRAESERMNRPLLLALGQECLENVERINPDLRGQLQDAFQLG